MLIWPETYRLESGETVTVDERLLKIEQERLAMEKRRDKNATLRFLMGSVLLVVGTSAASLFINEQQEKRALFASEQQWIVPILLNFKADDFDGKEEFIQETLSLGLTDKMTSYLQSQIVKLTAGKKAIAEQLAIANAAKEEQQRLENIAADALARAAEQEKLQNAEEAQKALEDAQNAADAVAESERRLTEYRSFIQEELKRFNDPQLYPF